MMRQVEMRLYGTLARGSQTVGVPIFPKGSPFSRENGDPGSPFLWGPRVPIFMGSPKFYDTGSPTLHSDSQASTGLHMFHDIDLREIFECAHLVSGRSKQASKQANKHTHARAQTVTLVWGSLRLAPINQFVRSAPEQPAVDGRSVAAVTNKK